MNVLMYYRTSYNKLDFKIKLQMVSARLRLSHTGQILSIIHLSSGLVRIVVRVDGISEV